MADSTMNCSTVAMDSLGAQVNRTSPSTLEVWGIGLVAVTIINSCAAVGIAIMPILGRQSYHYLLTCLIGLGVGSLSGSALFHLLPEAFNLKGHDYTWKCWTAIAGVYLFFMVDKLLKLVLRLKKQRKLTSVTIATGEKYAVTVCQNGNAPSSPNSKIGGELSSSTNSNIDSTFNNNDSLANSMDVIVAGTHKKESIAEKSKEVAPVAWMIIFGDAIHNFIDGISIGAAFTESILSGVSICVAVICEEFPHEFGDIAILVSSGMSMKKALGYNLLSAMTCYAGFVIGVLVGELSEATVYVFALAAGMFLYVALANMIPEMNESMEKAMDDSMQKGLIIGALQFLGISTGLVIMFLLDFYDSTIQF